MSVLTPASSANASSRGFALRGLQAAALAAALAVAAASFAQERAPASAGPEAARTPVEATAAGAAPEPPAAPASDPGDPPDLKLGPLEYRVARGLRFGESGLTIGGFATVEIERPDAEPAEIALDGINFLAQFEPVDSFRVFAELEVGDLASWETSGGAVESDPQANFERLYAEYGRSDALTVRFGKFLTPVGQWNLAPAEPFVWTPTQPAIVEFGFDEYQTGVALFGSFHPRQRRVSYWLYGQVIDAFDVEPDERPAERSVGARLETSDARGTWTLGASLLASERNGAWTTAGGLDAKWRGTRLELSSELLVSGGDLPDRDHWGAFLEAAYPLDRVSSKLARLYLVGRVEHFDPRGERATQLLDFGVTWLPADWLSLKLGYRAAIRDRDELGDGLKLTLSVLF